jgi:hypothetical protein
MKVKVFNLMVSGLEEAINNWMTDPVNKIIKVEYVSVSVVQDQYQVRAIALIFYESSEK